MPYIKTMMWDNISNEKKNLPSSSSVILRNLSQKVAMVMWALVFLTADKSLESDWSKS